MTDMVQCTMRQCDEKVGSKGDDRVAYSLDEQVEGCDQGLDVHF